MPLPNPIYLDYAATTPVHPEVLEAMLPYFSQVFGNPSSVHFYGQQAESALEATRESIAAHLNCRPGEIIFTSCGSESDNLALRGIALAAKAQRGAKHLLISPVEHHAVSRSAEQLAAWYGFELETLPVDASGQVDPAQVEKRLRSDTAVVSVIYANNEIGTINQLADIGALCRSHGIPFHSDAVQAGAYCTLDVEELQVDLLSLGAHKFYGPKGVGVLFVRHELRKNLAPSQTGGGQEFGLRAGTHNIPLIVGMGRALELAVTQRAQRIAELAPLRDYLVGQVLELIPHACLTGHPSRRLPNHASFAFEGVDGNALLAQLDLAGFACSSGSACKTGSPEPSEVLTAIGLDRRWALGSLRVTLGMGSTAGQVAAFLEALPGLVAANRRLAGAFPQIED